MNQNVEMRIYRCKCL